ncbi:MAG: ATP-binding cassette domain-containing protein [Actinomycetota bacterium]|nr:ATP-binding cassette domain-containing protein [Actinomycetota bacterium]
MKIKVKNINLKVKKGEVIGLGGLNGQGQEELLLLISGVLLPTSGEIRIMDKPVRFKASQ